MDFFAKSIDILQTLVIELGGGLCVWGGTSFLEGYGQDNPTSNACHKVTRQHLEKSRKSQ